MTQKFLAMLLAAVLGAMGVLAFSTERPSSKSSEYASDAAPVVKTSLAADSADRNSIADASNEAYLADFKSGYADGFGAGAAGYAYPDQTAMTNNSRGFVDGYSQGYTDGQGQQATLQSLLCRNASAAAVSPGYYSGQSNLTQPRAVSSRASSQVLSDRYYARREVDRGIGTTARKALLIAGGAAAGAGLGGAFGGKKGALIGALVGGGTGTALAVTKKPSRAFNRRVSTKSTLTKTLIGAGAGAAIGALAGGKRGALAGAALGGGGGALWSVMSGKRARY
jgi:hypothetical protein